jgi:hypothetical protein
LDPVLENFFGQSITNNMADQIIPDKFPEDQQQFMEKPPGDPWEDITQWVLNNVPGVDVEKFVAEIEAIRAKHNAELQPLADSIIEESKRDLDDEK